MAKQVKSAKQVKPKRKIRFQAVATLYFFFSFVIYLGSMTFVKAYNYVLSTQIAAIEADRNDLQAQVSNLETVVKEMSNYDYIASIAEKDGIKANQSNVKILSANK